MSQEHVTFARTVDAAADLSAKQYYIVIQSSGQVNLSTSAGAGGNVLKNKPESGEAAELAVLGTSKVIAGAAISEGAYVTNNTSGKAVATTTSTHKVIGKALEAATADGDIIEIELMHFIYP